MNRSELLSRLDDTSAPWDIIIIGGGATGLGCAVEAATRGYRTLLLEQHDFAKGTSSRSTKLIHGGVRYLKQGNIALVLEALRERGRLRHNAPHLVHDLPFVVPSYDWWEGPFYGIGLKLYDALAGRLGFGSSEHLSREETLKHLPTLEPDGLRGGTLYYDGQFDDARLALVLAQTGIDYGATVLNYIEVVRLTKSGDLVDGVIAHDGESSKEYELKARVVINATGIFSDSILKMDDPDSPNMIQMSQGVHVVLDSSFLPSSSAIMVPRTDDGRVLFAIPWLDRIVIGTTDTPVESSALEPTPLKEEVEFLLEHAVRYLTKDPSLDDVLSVFAGLRPLVSTGGSDDTSSISREHTIHISKAGLVSIMGGKWTTYRKMAEDTIDQAATIAELDEQRSVTSNLKLHGWINDVESLETLAHYGSDAQEVLNLNDEVLGASKRLHPALPYTKGEVHWAVRNEMALSVEDVLARRTRALLLDARASASIAPEVAKIVATERGKDQKWTDDQVAKFRGLAARYLPYPEL